MWLLPTRGRAELCQEALDTCAAASMTSKLLVMIDSRIDEYPDLKNPMPKTCEIIRQPFDMADCMRFIFDVFPDEKNYGWLADDLQPETKGFDKILEQAAGDWCVADCNDGGFIGTINHNKEHSLCGAFCWGGELIRTVGWWALPGVQQAGIDDAWTEIVTYALPKLRKYQADCIVNHFHFKTGKRPFDNTDLWERDGIQYIENDFQKFNNWKARGGAKKAAEKIRIKLKENNIQL